jgi:hypothetical protein
MGNEVSVSSQQQEFVDVYDLIAGLAGHEYTRTNAIRYMNLLIEVSRSPFVSTDVKRAIGFVERFSLSLCNLKPDQMAELVEMIQENRKADSDGF